MVEENHYYAYGLKIAGISSHKLPDVHEGHVDNRNLYNDKELFDEGDLNWYDYGFRNYDPQIGRFPQLDPLTDEYPELTPYQYASCEPIANIDIDGLEKCPVNVLGNGITGAVSSAGSGLSRIASGASIIVNITSGVLNNVASSNGTNQSGGKITILPEVAKNPNYTTAIGYIQKTKEFSDMFAQFINGSLGNTDLVFDISYGFDEAGHSGIYGKGEFEGFRKPIGEWAQSGILEATELSADMPLQIKLQFGKYDKRSINDVGYNTETIVHELVLHISSMIKIVKYLRSGASMENVVAMWYKETQAGGEANDDKQHIDFTNHKTKIRQSFDNAIKELSKTMKNITHQRQLSKAILDDVRIQKENYNLK